MIFFIINCNYPVSFPAHPAGFIFAIKNIDMAKKLQPDVIEWILKLNSNQAQEEYHKLEKVTRVKAS